MMNPFRTIHRLALATLAPIALAATAGAQSALPEIKIDNTPVPPSATTYAPVVEKVAPCIVTVSTKRNVSTVAGGDPREELFRRWFGLPEQEEEPAPRRGQPKGKPEKQRKQPAGLGSGVVVTPEGHILTNNHVIDGADEIIVTLGDDKHEYVAKKIGADPEADIAVLKIDDAKVQAITFTDSDKLRIGDMVLAVGNPFGLTRSVSAGIVSSTGRGNMNGMRMAVYENYIQTDASINPGNSGGALVDIQGRLVGINTSIVSRSGGNEGIGFAVPSNLARSIMESILKNGRVVRGFLGIGLQDIDENLAEQLKHSGTDGALVTEVQPKSPAEKAGIRTRDIVTEVEGRKIVSERGLRLFVASMNPGAKVAVKVSRDGQEKSFTVELAEKPPRELARADKPATPDPDPDVLDGVTVADLDAQARKEFAVPEGTKGALVTRLEADSPSAEFGIKVGDVILEVARQPVADAAEAVKMSEKVKKDKKVLLLVSTRGNNRFVTVERKD